MIEMVCSRCNEELMEIKKVYKECKFLCLSTLGQMIRADDMLMENGPPLLSSTCCATCSELINAVLPVGSSWKMGRM